MDNDGAPQETASLLPSNQDPTLGQVPAEHVTRIALRLKYQIEHVVPVELAAEKVTQAPSPVITPHVVETARKAGGKEYEHCVVYGLLICKSWFIHQAKVELWEADLHHVRAIACEVIAKHIIESEEDTDRLFIRILLQRFSIITSSAPYAESTPTNVVERAVDLHALHVIGSSGYQKCVSYLWHGWLVQDDQNPTRFTFYKDRANRGYWIHLDPDRMRVPKYQNATQVLFSLVYLGLYTGAINTINPTGDIDLVEALLYLFTLAFTCAEVSRIWKVGRYAIGFWNVFNITLYVLLAVSFVTRMIALGHLPNHSDNHTDAYQTVIFPTELESPKNSAAWDERRRFNHLSYNFLAFTAPMFWMRMLLYIDSLPFFGAMLIVVKTMFAESLIFFALLVFVLVGFFQGFLGLDLVDEQVDKASFIWASMANAIMSSPNFEGFDNFAPPFGITLYYLFSFVIMVILLNILIALYNSSYEDVSSNATDEYMALFSAKCLQFIRAPDEFVFIPPFNLIEMVLLILPFEWWLSSKTYAKLNAYVMGVLYAPLLAITAALERRDAKKIVWNRRRGEADDDTVQPWEVTGWTPGTQEEHDWCKRVQDTSPDPAKSPVLVELEALREEVKELRSALER